MGIGEKMAEIVEQHRIDRAEAEFRVGNTLYPAGSFVIGASQPYRPFALTMLRPQRYPEVVPYAGGPIYPPYDVTSWSLPISMGVEIAEADVPVRAPLTRLDAPVWPGGRVEPGRGGYLIPHSTDSAFTAMNRLLKQGKKLYWQQEAAAGGAVGDIYLPADQATPAQLTRLSREVHVPIRPLQAAPSGKFFQVKPTRVGLYKPWRASMDEGWTRWLLEQYEFPYINLSNEKIKDGSFQKETDVLLFPDVGKNIIKDGGSGRSSSPLPPEYRGGLGKEGGERIKKWVEEARHRVRHVWYHDTIGDPELTGIPTTEWPGPVV